MSKVLVVGVFYLSTQDLLGIVFIRVKIREMDYATYKVHYVCRYTDKMFLTSLPTYKSSIGTMYKDTM